MAAHITAISAIQFNLSCYAISAAGIGRAVFAALGADRIENSRVSILVVLLQHPATFSGFPELMKDVPREQAHPPFLVLIEGGIERLPRIGELPQRVCSLNSMRQRAHA